MDCSRREFLKHALPSVTVLSLAPTLPRFLVRSALAADGQSPSEGTVLVVIQLTGGCDGLNTVVPYGDDEYFVGRPTIRLPLPGLHKIDSHLGFHPRMEALWRLQREGKLSIVQGVGYPNPKSEHPAAMRVWHTGLLQDDSCQTGWLGRAVDHACQPADVQVRAACVGLASAPRGLVAEKAVIPSVGVADDWVLRRMPGAGEDKAAECVESASTEAAVDENPALAFVQRVLLAAQAGSERIQAAGGSPTARDYPPCQLAERLRSVAALIRADLGVRIYFTELGGEGFGGFDNHANQLGNHCALLNQLSECVAAFAAELERDRLLDRVVVMTFSEFGRTVRENGRRGTDHGAAAPMFLIGGRLQAGVVGEHPSLTDLESNGGLKHHLDFRRVYATILDRWLRFPSQSVLGETFAPLDLFQV